MSKGFDDALTAIQQRWLALGLLAFVILIFGLLIIAPIISKGLSLHDSKNNLLFKLRQYERILANKETVNDWKNNITQQSQEQRYFNGQETEALASADMGEFIKQTITEAGGQLNSTQSIPAAENSSDDDATTKFTRIAVRVSMTGNSEALRSLLYKIETAQPLMIIDEIDIRPVRGRRNRRTGQIDGSNDLTVNFRVVSFMRKKVRDE